MSQPFLLDPDHQAFVEGTSRRLPVRAHGCVLLFMVPFVFAGVLIIFFLVRQWTEAIILATAAVETRAQLLDRRIDDSGDDTSYYVTYRFVVDDQVYQPEESVRRSTYNTVPSLALLTVRYAPHNPNLASVESENWGGLLALTAFVVCWDGFVLFIILYFGRDLVKRRRLARTGILLDGEVVGCSGSRDGDGDYQLKLSYRFLSPLTHVWIEDNLSHQRNDLKTGPLPDPGTPVHVIYLHDRLYLVL